MKTNLLAALDVTATVLNVAVWAWIASAVILLAALGALAILAGRATGDAIARRRIHRGLHRLEHHANQPAIHIPAQTRREKS